MVLVCEQEKQMTLVFAELDFYKGFFFIKFELELVFIAVLKLNWIINSNGEHILLSFILDQLSYLA